VAKGFDLIQAMAGVRQLWDTWSGSNHQLAAISSFQEEATDNLILECSGVLHTTQVRRFVATCVHVLQIASLWCSPIGGFEGP
jgi:hypothetical protein